MNKLLFLFAFWIVSTGLCQAQTRWDRTYNFAATPIPEPDYYISTLNDALPVDGGILVTVVTVDTAHPKLISYISKLNGSGDTVWVRHLRDTADYLSSLGGVLTQISADRFAHLGTPGRHPTVQANMWRPAIHLFNASGDSIRRFYFADSVRSLYAYSLLADTAGRLLVFGSTSSIGTHLVNNQTGVHNPDTTYVWLAAFDTLGNLIWQQRRHPERATASTYAFVAPITFTLSGDKKSFVVSASGTNQSNFSISDPYLAKYDWNGNPLWRWWMPPYTYTPVPAWKCFPALFGREATLLPEERQPARQ